MHQNHRFFKVQHTISILAARKNPRTYCSITFNPTPCNHCQLFWSICQKIMEPKWLTTLKKMIRTKGWNHLKPKLSAELWMKAVHKLCCKKNQWQTTYPYLNHVLSGHITLSAHIQNASFHLYQYNKKDTKGLSSLPLATPQLFTSPNPSGPNPLSSMILGWCYAKGWSPRMIGKHTTHQHPRSHCLRRVRIFLKQIGLGRININSNCAQCFRNFLQMNDC